eukprot:COSAG01_NODE_2074_length_8491_cov_4.600024_12_plen_175_part_00
MAASDRGRCVVRHALQPVDLTGSYLCDVCSCHEILRAQRTRAGHRRTVDGVPAAQRFAHPTQRGAPLLQTWNPLPLPPGHKPPPCPPPPTTSEGSPAVTEAGPWLLDGGSPKQPPSVIARAWFERPLVDLETPGVLASLRAAQGRAGLWLCGSYTLPGGERAVASFLAAVLTEI